MTNNISKLNANRKTNNLIKIYPLLYLLIFLLAGCNSTDVSSPDSLFASVGSIDENSQFLSVSQDEVEISFSDLSEESPLPTPHELLDEAISATENKSEYKYVLSASLDSQNSSSNLKSEIIKNGSDISLAFDLISSGVHLRKTEDYYLNGISYINDVILGKCMFESKLQDFENYTKDIYPIYKISYLPESVIQFENGTFEYSFSEDILEERFIQELLSQPFKEQIYFNNGKCTVATKNNEISQINGFIKAHSIVDGNSVAFEINFEVSIDDALDITEPICDEYKDYDTTVAFMISKSSYNIASHNGYEISENSRFYSDSEKNIFHDIASSITVSFKNESLNFKQRKELSGQVNQIFEKKILEQTQYVRQYYSDKDAPEYTISEYAGNSDQISVINLWNNFTFDVFNFKEYSLNETDDYYVIKFIYLDEVSNNMLLSYESMIYSEFPDLMSKTSDFKINKINQASGEAIIRKKDCLLIEQKIDISITYSKAKTHKLFYSYEIIALDNDVDPTTKN